MMACICKVFILDGNLFGAELKMLSPIYLFFVLLHKTI